MKRREFLKDAGIFGCGCALGAGCFKLTSEKKSKNIEKENIDKFEVTDWLEHIEISLTYHCNLNCASCYHCASIAPKYFMPLDIYEKDIAQMQNITQGKIKNIMLLGGEPLLNKNVEKYINITRNYFKETEIILFTNGLILNDMPDSFWKTCSKNNTVIRHTLYPLFEHYPNLSDSYKKAKKYNVRLISGAPRYEFGSMQLNKKKLNNKIERYNNCNSKFKCSTLDNGLLYPCYIIPTTKLIFNEHFKKYALPVEKNDYLDIYKISSIDEILEFYKKPKEFCKYCNNDTLEGKKLWTYSKRELCEWYDV